METVDIHFKDEGDFVTTCFQTPKAIQFLNIQAPIVKEKAYGSDTYKKLSFDIGDYPKMLSWVTRQKYLTFDTDVDLDEDF
jgi:hypothetical protein